MKKYLKALFLITIFVSCTKYQAVRAFESKIQGRQFLQEGDNQIFASDISDEQVEEFLNDLKIAVNNNDKEAVAALIHFPCIWNRRGKQRIFITRENFLHHYNSIITPQVKEAINQANLENLVAKYYRFMLEEGRVWFVPPHICSFSEHGPNNY